MCLWQSACLLRRQSVTVFAQLEELIIELQLFTAVASYTYAVMSTASGKDHGSPVSSKSHCGLRDETAAKPAFLEGLLCHLSQSRLGLCDA